MKSEAAFCLITFVLCLNGKSKYHLIETDDGHEGIIKDNLKHPRLILILLTHPQILRLIYLHFLGTMGEHLILLKEGFHLILLPVGWIRNLRKTMSMSANVKRQAHCTILIFPQN